MLLQDTDIAEYKSKDEKKDERYHRILSILFAYVHSNYELPQ